MKYLIYAISTIRDALIYNEHSLLNGNILNRIEKEMSILENSEEIKYTKEQFEKFHLDLLELGVILLPTSEKAIRILDERKKISKRKIESYKRAEKVCQEFRYQMAIAGRNDMSKVCKYLFHWMNITGKKIKYKRPKKLKNKE